MTKITEFISLPLYEISEPVIIAKDSINYITPLREDYKHSVIILHDETKLLVNLSTSGIMELL